METYQNPIKWADNYKWDPKRKTVKDAIWNSIKTYDDLKWDTRKKN